MTDEQDLDDRRELSRLRDEAEQLRAALKSAEEEIARLIEHRNRLMVRVTIQGRELRCANLAYDRAREALEAETLARARLQLSRSQEEEKLRLAFEELQVVTGELEVANAGLRQANQELDARVRERTRAIKESEERLLSAIEVGRIGLWDWDLVTGAIHWSDEHFRMEGYAVGEVTPSYGVWITRVHPDDRNGLEAALEHARTTRQEYVREFRVIHPDGEVRWLYGRGRFRYDEAGEPVRMIGAVIDVTERREWEERQQVLVAELQHRTRNLIGVIASLAEKTLRTSADLADFGSRFRDRLAALARVQGLLSRLNDVDRVTFDDLIRTELSAMDGGSERVFVDGPCEIKLRSSTVQILAMAVHELATNAVKYGALSQPDARLSITWRIEEEGAEGKSWLHIDWRESGVTIQRGADACHKVGQGRELIERALPYQLRARTSYVLGPDGVHCTIALPVSPSTVAPSRREPDGDG